MLVTKTNIFTPEQKQTLVCCEWAMRTAVKHTCGTLQVINSKDNKNGKTVLLQALSLTHSRSLNLHIVPITDEQTCLQCG